MHIVELSRCGLWLRKSMARSGLMRAMRREVMDKDRGILSR